MRSLAILGAGGHGRMVADCAAEASWEEIVFFDDTPREGPWPVAGGAEDLLGRAGDYDGVIVAIGDNAARLSWHRRLTDAGVVPATIVHPRAFASSRCTIGPGSVLAAGAVVNIGARLGQAVIVNTGATIDHDCVLEDGVHVSPGAHLAGGVVVGAESWIGIGAAVREGVRIGAAARIGAGAAVVATVGDGLTMAGVPARPLKPGRA